MACYSFHVDIIGRNRGGSIVGTAAYNNGIRLYDDYYGSRYDHSDRMDVLYRGILLPGVAPARLAELQIFLNELNNSERRKDSQLAQSIKLALPLELMPEEQLALLKEFCNQNFVSNGRCVNYAIHSGICEPSRKPDSFLSVSERKDNPHAHLLVPFRQVDNTGFRMTKLDSRSQNRIADLVALRKSWADFQNQALERGGFDARVTHKSFAAQGIDLPPTQHVGAATLVNELKGIPTKPVDAYLRILAMRQNLERDKNSIEMQLKQRAIQRKEEKERIALQQHSQKLDLLREEERLQDLQREQPCRELMREY